MSEGISSVFDDGPEFAGGKVDVAPRMEPVKAESDGGEKAREEAFNGVFQWKGQKLHGFSIRRYNIFLGLRVSVGAPPLWRALADYEAFYADAVRILWICSQTDLVLDALRADPAVMDKEVTDWAEQFAAPAGDLDVIAQGIKIYNSAQENKHVPAPLAAGTHGDDAGN